MVKVIYREIDRETRETERQRETDAEKRERQRGKDR